MMSQIVMMIGQHLLRYWLAVSKQQAITLANVDQVV